MGLVDQIIGRVSNVPEVFLTFGHWQSWFFHVPFGLVLASSFKITLAQGGQGLCVTLQVSPGVLELQT